MKMFKDDIRPDKKIYIPLCFYFNLFAEYLDAIAYIDLHSTMLLL